ncbi:hypothetical protein VTP01DRAFT_1673 [Rhizomucor pusillus]|uniref:uncharacterized protein n=1 Tax=Rhizomucor pusillus TaxID=4840 RepID=UPI0037445D26
MLSEINLKGKVTKYDCVVIDGGYALFVDRVLPNNSYLGKQNFVVRVRKHRGADLTAEDAKYNSVLGSFRFIHRSTHGCVEVCTKCTAVDHFGNYCHKKQTRKHDRKHLFLFGQFKPVLPPFPSAAVNNSGTLPAALSAQGTFVHLIYAANAKVTLFFLLDNAAMALDGDDAGMDMEVDMDSEPCDEARLILPSGTLRLDDGNNVFDDAEPEGEVDDAEQGNELFHADDEYLREEVEHTEIEWTTAGAFRDPMYWFIAIFLGVI